MEYLTTVEMSEKWGISSRRIGILCADNRIPGVIKKGKTWLIAFDSVKPVMLERRLRFQKINKERRQEGNTF